MSINKYLKRTIAFLCAVCLVMAGEGRPGLEAWAAVLNYTVDFQWEDSSYRLPNGKSLFSIQGGGYVKVSDLLQTLGVEAGTDISEIDSVGSESSADISEIGSVGSESSADIDVAPLYDIKNVTFSNPELVWAGKARSDTTIGGLKSVYGLSSVYSADLAEEEIIAIDETEVRAGEWVLISLKPFDTDEKLVVELSDGRRINIDISDAQSVSKDGFTFSVNTSTKLASVTRRTAGTSTLARLPGIINNATVNSVSSSMFPANSKTLLELSYVNTLFPSAINVPQLKTELTDAEKKQLYGVDASGNANVSNPDVKAGANNDTSMSQVWKEAKLNDDGNLEITMSFFQKQGQPIDFILVCDETGSMANAATAKVGGVSITAPRFIWARAAILKAAKALLDANDAENYDPPYRNRVAFLVWDNRAQLASGFFDDYDTANAWIANQYTGHNGTDHAQTIKTLLPMIQNSKNTNPEALQVVVYLSDFADGGDASTYITYNGVRDRAYNLFNANAVIYGLNMFGGTSVNVRQTTISRQGHNYVSGSDPSKLLPAFQNIIEDAISNADANLKIQDELSDGVKQQAEANRSGIDGGSSANANDDSSSQAATYNDGTLNWNMNNGTTSDGAAKPLKTGRLYQKTVTIPITDEAWGDSGYSGQMPTNKGLTLVDGSGNVINSIGVDDPGESPRLTIPVKFRLWRLKTDGTHEEALSGITFTMRELDENGDQVGDSKSYTTAGGAFAVSYRDFHFVPGHSYVLTESESSVAEYNTSNPSRKIIAPDKGWIMSIGADGYAIISAVEAGAARTIPMEVKDGIFQIYNDEKLESVLVPVTVKKIWKGNGPKFDVPFTIYGINDGNEYELRAFSEADTESLVVDHLGVEDETYPGSNEWRRIVYVPNMTIVDDQPVIFSGGAGIDMPRAENSYSMDLTPYKDSNGVVYTERSYNYNIVEDRLPLRDDGWFESIVSGYNELVSVDETTTTTYTIDDADAIDYYNQTSSDYYTAQLMVDLKDFKITQTPVPTYHVSSLSYSTTGWYFDALFLLHGHISPIIYGTHTVTLKNANAYELSDDKNIKEPSLLIYTLKEATLVLENPDSVTRQAEIKFSIPNTNNLSSTQMFQYIRLPKEWEDTASSVEVKSLTFVDKNNQTIPIYGGEVNPDAVVEIYAVGSTVENTTNKTITNVSPARKWVLEKTETETRSINIRTLEMSNIWHPNTLIPLTVKKVWSGTTSSEQKAVNNPLTFTITGTATGKTVEVHDTDSWDSEVVTSITGNPDENEWSRLVFVPAYDTSTGTAIAHGDYEISEGALAVAGEAEGNPQGRWNVATGAPEQSYYNGNGASNGEWIDSDAYQEGYIHWAFDDEYVTSSGHNGNYNTVYGMTLYYRDASGTSYESDVQFQTAHNINNEGTYTGHKDYYVKILLPQNVDPSELVLIGRFTTSGNKYTLDDTYIGINHHYGTATGYNSLAHYGVITYNSTHYEFNGLPDFRMVNDPYKDVKNTSGQTQLSGVEFLPLETEFEEGADVYEHTYTGSEPTLRVYSKNVLTVTNTFSPYKLVNISNTFADTTDDHESTGHIGKVNYTVTGNGENRVLSADKGSSVSLYLPEGSYSVTQTGYGLQNGDTIVTNPANNPYAITLTNAAQDSTKITGSFTADSDAGTPLNITFDNVRKNYPVTVQMEWDPVLEGTSPTDSNREDPLKGKNVNYTLKYFSVSGNGFVPTTEEGALDAWVSTVHNSQVPAYSVDGQLLKCDMGEGNDDVYAMLPDYDVEIVTEEIATGDPAKPVRLIYTFVCTLKKAEFYINKMWNVDDPADIPDSITFELSRSDGKNISGTGSGTMTFTMTKAANSLSADVWEYPMDGETIKLPVSKSYEPDVYYIYKEVTLDGTALADSDFRAEYSDMNPAAHAFTMTGEDDGTQARFRLAVSLGGNSASGGSGSGGTGGGSGGTGSGSGGTGGGSGGTGSGSGGTGSGSGGTGSGSGTLGQLPETMSMVVANKERTTQFTISKKWRDISGRYLSDSAASYHTAQVRLIGVKKTDKSPVFLDAGTLTKQSDWRGKFMSDLEAAGEGDIRIYEGGEYDLSSDNNFTVTATDIPASYVYYALEINVDGESLVDMTFDSDGILTALDATAEEGYLHPTYAYLQATSDAIGSVTITNNLAYICKIVQYSLTDSSGTVVATFATQAERAKYIQDHAELTLDQAAPVENPFYKLNDAVSFSRSEYSGLNGKAIIEMLVDYEFPDNDIVTLGTNDIDYDGGAVSVTDDVVFTTARTTGGVYNFIDTLNGKAEAENGTSILIRSFDGDSLFKVTSAGAKVAFTNIILDGGTEVGSSGAGDTGSGSGSGGGSGSGSGSVDGFACYANGGLVSASAGSISVNNGTTMRNTKTKDNNPDDDSHSSALTADDVLLLDSGKGGAIFAADGATVTVNGSGTNGRPGVLFENCAGEYGGAIHAETGDVSINGGASGTGPGVSFSRCYADNNGGAVYSASGLTVAGTSSNRIQFWDCSTTGGNGGAIYTAGDTADTQISISNCDFEDCFVNNTSGQGGAMYFTNGAQNLTDVNVDGVADGHKDSQGIDAWQGGGIYLAGGDLTLTHVVLHDCHVSNTGTDSSVSANSNGGGIYLAGGTLTVKGNSNGASEFKECAAPNGSGGAIYSTSSAINSTTGVTVSIVNTNIDGHFAHPGNPSVPEGEEPNDDPIDIGSDGGEDQDPFTGDGTPDDDDVLPGQAIIPADTHLEDDIPNAKNGGAIYINDGTLSLGGSGADDGVSIKNCTVTLNGGAIYSNSSSMGSASGVTVKLSNVTIDGHDQDRPGAPMAEGFMNAVNGGAIFLRQGTLDITGGEIRNCRVHSNGGTIYNNSNARTAYGAGAEAYEATVRINGMTFKGFSGSNGEYPNAEYGGVIYNHVGRLRVIDSSFYDFKASKAGGALYEDNAQETAFGTVFLQNVTFDGHAGGLKDTVPNAQLGGAVYTASNGDTRKGGTVRMTDCRFLDCTVSERGGAIYSLSTMRNVNKADADEYSNEPTLHIIDTIIDGHDSLPYVSTEDNTPIYNAQRGGGILLANGTMELETRTGVTAEIRDCTVSDYGGGIDSYGGGTQFKNVSGFTPWSADDYTVKLIDAMITNCSAGISGGGINIKSILTMMDSKIVNCSAAKNGGAVNSYGGLTATTTNTTVININDPAHPNVISGNTAGEKGAGIYMLQTVKASGSEAKLKLAGAQNFGGSGVNASGKLSSADTTFAVKRRVNGADAEGNPALIEEDVPVTVGNFVTMGSGFKTGSDEPKNGGQDYLKEDENYEIRQDIYIAGFLRASNYMPATSLHVTGAIPNEITNDVGSNDGSIWIWAELPEAENENNHYQQLMQFAVFTDSLAEEDKASTVRVFRNAADDERTENGTDTYLTGSLDGDLDVPAEADFAGYIYWTGVSGYRTVSLRKAAKTSREALAGATFNLYKGGSTNSYVWKDRNDKTKTEVLGREIIDGTAIEHLTSQTSGVIWIGELPYGVYYLEETNAPSGSGYEGNKGKWFYLVVGDDTVPGSKDGVVMSRAYESRDAARTAYEATKQ